MKNYKVLYHLSFLLCMFLCTQSAHASHMAGGSMTYRCLGNNMYEITLEFRRDCINGAPDAQFDPEAIIGIFNGDNMQLDPTLIGGGIFRIPLSVEDTLNELVMSECNIIGGDVCTETTTYRDTIILPYRPGRDGYYISYQRCCRNVKLNNIKNPTEIGATYFVRITEEALRTCNSAPSFNSWPISFICVNDTLRFDHSATDIDGDSLVYEFCAPSIGGSVDLPRPNPPSQPPYDIIQPADYQQSPIMYSANRPFGDNIFMEIDPNTGMITGYPEVNGQYLIGVCVREFRNGELLTEVKRDFEYIVRTCGRAPNVMFDTDPPGITTKCDGLDIAFVNNTESNFKDPDSLDYIWYFDWPNNTLVSTEMDPAIIYPQPGLYTIALIGDDGTCRDTFFYELGISTPVDPEVGFEVFSSNCDGDVEVYLLDTTITEQQILEREWILVGEGFNDTLYGINPSTFIGFNQEIEVTLNIYTESGCDGVLVDTLLIEPPEFGNEFVDQIICDGALTVLFTNTNEDAEVTITPDDNIVVIGNEYNLVNFVGEQDFIVTVSDTFCTTTDTITIQTFPQPMLNLEDLVQCGQDTVDINPNGNPDYYYVWSSTLDSLPFDENESNPIFSLNTTAQFFVQVFTSENSNCFSFDTMEVKVVPYPEFDFFPSANIITCQDSSLTISVNSQDSVIWTNAGGIQIGTGPEITINQVIQNAVLTATAINEDGCSTSQEVNVSISSEPNFSFTDDSEDIVCIGDSATLEIISTDSIVWTNLDGDVLQIGNSITLDSVVQPVTVVVTAYNQFGCPGSDMITVETYEDPSFELIDSTELDVCFGESTIVNVATPDSVVWTDLDGNILNLGNAIIVEDIQQYPSIVITVISDDGCSITDTLEFATLSLPMPDLDPVDNIVVCLGDDYTVELNSIDSVTWMTMDEIVLATGNPLELTEILTDTLYQIVFTTEAGCEIRDTFDIIIQNDIQLSIDNNDDGIYYCTGDSVTLNANTVEIAEIEWFENGQLIGTGTSIEFGPIGNTVVTAVATDTLGCTEMDSIAIFESIVDGELLAPSSLCLLDTVPLEIIINDPNAVAEIIWSPDSLIIGEGTQVFTSPSTTTTYTVLVIDTVGCSNEFSATVQVGGFAFDLNAMADPDEILFSESSQLSVEFDPSYEYQWEPSESLDNPNISDPIATPDVTTTYSVTVTDEFGCTGTDTVTVIVIQPNCDESDIFVPNLFTPNGDNFNDTYRIESNFIESMNLIIYNRWGQEVFSSISQDDEWDGTFEGKDLAPDVFSFYVQIICINGFEYQTQGNITLQK